MLDAVQLVRAGRRDGRRNGKRNGRRNGKRNGRRNGKRNGRCTSRRDDNAVSSYATVEEQAGVTMPTKRPVTARNGRATNA